MDSPCGPTRLLTMAYSYQQWSAGNLLWWPYREVHVLCFSWSNILLAHLVWQRTEAGECEMWMNEPSNQYFVWYGPYLLFWFLCGILPIWDGAGLLGITVVPSPFFHSSAFGLRFRAWGWFGYWGFRVHAFEMMQSLWMVLSRLSHLYLFIQAVLLFWVQPRSDRWALSYAKEYDCWMLLWLKIVWQ